MGVVVTPVQPVFSETSPVQWKTHPTCRPAFFRLFILQLVPRVTIVETDSQATIIETDSQATIVETDSQATIVETESQASIVETGSQLRPETILNFVFVFSVYLVPLVSFKTDQKVTFFFLQATSIPHPQTEQCQSTSRANCSSLLDLIIHVHLYCVMISS